MISRFAILALLTVLAGSATGQEVKRGDQLLWQCNETASSKVEAFAGKLLCAGYVDGFIDSYRVSTTYYGRPDAFCLPATGLSIDQATRVVVRYLEDHPNELHESARSSVFLALRTAFACKR